MHPPPHASENIRFGWICSVLVFFLHYKTRAMGRRDAEANIPPIVTGWATGNHPLWDKAGFPPPAPQAWTKELICSCRQRPGWQPVNYSSYFLLWSEGQWAHSTGLGCLSIEEWREKSQLARYWKQPQLYFPIVLEGHQLDGGDHFTAIYDYYSTTHAGFVWAPC